MDSYSKSNLRNFDERIYFVMLTLLVAVLPPINVIFFASGEGLVHGLMFSVRVPGASGPAFEPWLGTLIVLFSWASQLTLLSQCLSLSRSANGYRRIVRET